MRQDHKLLATVQRHESCKHIAPNGKLWVFDSKGNIGLDRFSTVMERECITKYEGPFCQGSSK